MTTCPRWWWFGVIASGWLAAAPEAAVALLGDLAQEREWLDPGGSGAGLQCGECGDVSGGCPHPQGAGAQADLTVEVGDLQRLANLPVGADLCGEAVESLGAAVEDGGATVDGADLGPLLP